MDPASLLELLTRSLALKTAKQTYTSLLRLGQTGEFERLCKLEGNPGAWEWMLRLPVFGARWIILLWPGRLPHSFSTSSKMIEGLDRRLMGSGNRIPLWLAVSIGTFLVTALFGSSSLLLGLSPFLSNRRNQ